MKPPSNDSKTRKLAGAGVLAAIAASLCCITPVLALISGATGIAATFSWLEPFRPYLIGTTLLVLGFAWYQKLKPMTAEEVQCACEDDEKPSFWQSKRFLGIATIFALLMLAFPYYGEIFDPQPHHQVAIESSNNVKNVSFTVSGMTCSSCEEHVQHAVNDLPGIVAVKANSEKGSVKVEFDQSKTTVPEIERAIDATGYKVVNDK